MIVFFENGRLGNQLFQFAALRTLFPQERVLLIGFDELKDFVERKCLKNTLILPCKFWVWRRIFEKMLIILVGLRLVTGLKEINRKTGHKLVKNFGLLFRIKIVFRADFQHTDIAMKIKPNCVRIKKQYIDEALAFLEDNVALWQKRQLIFLHIRRGDYVRWPHQKYPAVLPLSWYQKCIKEIQETFENPVFIVVTDDAPYVRDCLLESKDLIVSECSAFVDLAIMSICSHGILSASSYSWWGAFLLKAKVTRI